MSKLVFEKGKLKNDNYQSPIVYLSSTDDNCELYFLTNLDYKLEIEEEDSVWISNAPLMDLPRLISFNVGGCRMSGDIPWEVQQHPRWNDFAFCIIRQDPPAFEFNLTGVSYKVSDFSVYDIDSTIIDSRILKQNQLTIIQHCVWEDSEIIKLKELYDKYHAKGLGIISFVEEGSGQWYDSKYFERYRAFRRNNHIEWPIIINDSYYGNSIRNLSRIDGSRYSYGSDVVGGEFWSPSCVVVDGDGKVLFDAYYSTSTKNVSTFIKSKVRDYEW